MPNFTLQFKAVIARKELDSKIKHQIIPGREARKSLFLEILDIQADF